MYLTRVTGGKIEVLKAVMLSHRGQSGLEVKILTSASNIWPRPGLDLVVLLCNRAFFRAKIV